MDADTTPIPATGEPAPDFEPPDETGTIHRLADQRGRWTVLYFYPKDDTPGCTTEACEFRDASDTIRERGADVCNSALHRDLLERQERIDDGTPILMRSFDHEHSHHVQVDARSRITSRRKFPACCVGRRPTRAHSAARIGSARNSSAFPSSRAVACDTC